MRASPAEGTAIEERTLGEGEAPKPGGSGKDAEGRRSLDSTLGLPRLPASPFPGEQAFAAGGLVAGRYRILRLIARGGMGEVYEAEDLELQGRVALKTLRSEAVLAPRALDRFRQEILLARKVTHRNVCRIFDVGWHREEGEEPGRGTVMFLTMELLPGVTLAERLKQVTRIPAQEAALLLRQMGEALAAAHRAGVIHRDFKSANVMLVPSQDGVRAVVTDFGLARSGAAGHTHSGAGEFLGTPSYMAPEQVEGKPASPATDIYALGVVAYEMLAGHLPFEADTPIGTAMKRLREDPPPLSGEVPGLPPELERLVHRCLARSPRDRFPDGAAFLQAMGGQAPRPPALSLLLRAGLLLGAGAAAVALAAAGVWVASRLRHSPSTPVAVPVKTRPSVAVLGFKNSTGRPDAAWLSTALSEMLTTELGAGEGLRTIPGENVARARKELRLGDPDSLGPETLERLKSRLGADYVVLGSYVALGAGSGGRLRVDVRLQSTAPGGSETLLAEEGTDERLFEVVSSAGSSLRRKLGVASVPAEELPAVKATQPTSPEAGRLYAEGLERLRRLETSEAVKLLQSAVTLEPAFPLAHAALGRAWGELGYQGREREESRKAFELSANLPREERLLVEGQYRTSISDWPKAVDLYKALWSFYPDNLEYGLLLADALSAGGRGKEALETVAALRRLPPPSSQDPRVDLAEARGAEATGDWKLQQEAASRAVQKAQAQGARFLEALGRLNLAKVLRRFGDSVGARREAESAMRCYQEVSDLAGVADAQRTEAHIAYSQGDYEQARRLGGDALKNYQAVGDQRGTAMALSILANVAYAQGDLAEAIRQYERCLAAFREVNERSSVARSLSNLANALFLKGELAQARARHEEALALSKEVGDPSAENFSLVALGEIQLAQGDPAGAQQRYQEALEGFRASGEKGAEAYALYGLGEVALARGDLEEARSRYEESLKVRTALGEKGTTADSRLALGAVDLEEGHPRAAEEAARGAAAEYRAEEASDQEALALALLARALLAQSRSAGAQEAAREAVAAASRTDNQGSRLAAALAEARVRAAQGETASARRQLEAILAEASRSGRAALALEARLLLAEAAIAGGERAAGSQQLAILQKEASSRGLLLLARKAGADLNKAR
jgi:tetratricopeptide (TPR) repeat protein